MRSTTSRRAKLELRRLDKWWRENRDHKDVFIDEFAATVKAIEDKPNVGRPYRTAKGKEVLYVLMRKTRYNVFYVVEDDVINIVSVWGAERGHGPTL